MLTATPEKAKTVNLTSTTIDPTAPWAEWPVFTTRKVSASELLVDTTKTGDFEAILNKKSLGTLSRQALREMGWVALFKVDFIDRLSQELAKSVINYRLSKTEGGFQLISNGSKIISFTPGWRDILDSRLAAQVIFNALSSISDQVTLDHVSQTENSLSMTFMTPTQHQITFAVGDVLNYGIKVTITPARDLIIEVYARRLSCLNGATTNKSCHRWTSQKHSDIESQLEWLQAATIKACDAFETITAKAKEMAETVIEGDVEQVIRARARAMGINDRHVDEVISAYEQEPGMTEWHVFNAFTSFATHSPNLDENERAGAQERAGLFMSTYKLVTAELPENVARRVGARIKRDEEVASA